jgi:hypothetical protein
MSRHHRHGHSNQVTSRTQNHTSTAKASFQSRMSRPREPQPCLHGAVSIPRRSSPSSPPAVAATPAATPRRCRRPAGRRRRPHTANRGGAKPCRKCPSLVAPMRGVVCRPRRPHRPPQRPAPPRLMQRRTSQIRPRDGWIRPPGRQVWSSAPPTTRTRRRSFFVQLPCSETAPKAARGPAAAIMEGCPDFRQPPPAAAGKGSGGGGRRGPAG